MVFDLNQNSIKLVWFLASEEEYIKKLEEHGLSKEEIDRRVKEAISKMKGWIDEKTALFVVAKEEGIEVDSQAIKQSSEQDYTIEQLSESTQNVNVVGRVTSFNDVRSFNRKDGSTGHYSSFKLFDGKNHIKVQLWDERAKIVKDNSFANNIIVRVLNGQVKRGRDQDLEIHIGSRSDIEISPTDVNPTSISSIDYSKFKVKISEITPNAKISKDTISVEGTVDQVFPKRAVKSKSTNEELFVQRMIIKDESGTIPVVFWNDDTKLIEKFQEGAKISLENLNAKAQYNDPNKMELSYKNGSRLDVLKKGQAPKLISIKDINLTMSRVSITGELALKNDVRTFTKKNDNSEGKLQRIQIQDPTGSIAIVFWQEDTTKLEKVDVGYKIQIDNVGVKADFRDNQKPELVFRSTSKISILDDSGSSTLDNITPIKEVLEKEGVYSIKGQIIQIGDTLKSITTSDGRTLKLFSVHLSDNSGAIQLTFWEDQAEKYADLGIGENLRVCRISTKMNTRIGVNSANFGRSSQLEKDVEFELTEEYTVPTYFSQNLDNASLDEITPIEVALEQEGYYTVEGQIIQMGDGLKSITTSDGRTLNLFSVHLSDNTGAIQLTFWEDKADEYSDLSVGDTIKVVGVKVKTNVRMGTNAASFGRNSQLEKNIDFNLTTPHEVQGFSSSQDASPMKFKGKYTSISQIEQSGMYEIKGNITEVKRISVYEACEKCLKNISSDSQNCSCEEGPVKSVYRMIISATVNDGTGDLPVTFFGDEAEQLIRKDAVTIHLKKQDSSYPEFEKEIVDSLKMMDLALMGQVSPSKYNEENEMKVREFKIIDLEDDDAINDLIDGIEN